MPLPAIVCHANFKVKFGVIGQIRRFCSEVFRFLGNNEAPLAAKILSKCPEPAVFLAGGQTIVLGNTSEVTGAQSSQAFSLA